jgi:hypothetical protein
VALTYISDKLAVVVVNYAAPLVKVAHTIWCSPVLVSAKLQVCGWGGEREGEMARLL